MGINKVLLLLNKHGDPPFLFHNLSPYNINNQYAKFEKKQCRFYLITGMTLSQCMLIGIWLSARSLAYDWQLFSCLYWNKINEITLGWYMYLRYTCQLSRLRRESHACGLKTSISRRLTFAGQFLTPDWKMWVIAVLLDTISKNMLTQTHVHVQNE